MKIDEWNAYSRATRQLAKRSPGRPVSTGSKATPVVSFRLGAKDYADLKALAPSYGLSVNAWARFATVLYLRAEMKKSPPGTE